MKNKHWKLCFNTASVPLVLASNTSILSINILSNMISLNNTLINNIISSMHIDYLLPRLAVIILFN